MIRRSKKPEATAVGRVVGKESVSDLLGENYPEVEEVQLRHVRLEGGVITLERGLDGGKPGNWMMVEALWPDGRVEDPIEALTKRKLHIVEWNTDSPRVELSDPKEQARLEKRRSRFAAAKQPLKSQVIDLTNGGHEKVRKPSGGYQPNSGYSPTSTAHYSREPTRLRGKGYERQGYQATGEVRPPLRGEYYEGVCGYARLSKIDFEERSFPILTKIGAPEPVDHFSGFFPQEIEDGPVQPGDMIEVDAEDVELLPGFRVVDLRDGAGLG